MTTRFILAFLLLTGTVNAGPLDLFRHPVRTVKRHPVAASLVFGTAAAIVDGLGMQHCRQINVENCRAKYGAAWQSFTFTTVANFGVIAAIKDCWKEQDWKFCSAFAYSGSAVQLGFGINQWKKEKQ